MSSILEALKKLEEEKATRRGAGGNIAGKVTAANRRSRQRPAWHLPAGIAAAVVAAVLVTYAAMGGFSPRPEVTSAGKGPAPASATATVPSPPADPRDGMKSEPMTRLPVPEPEPVRGAVPRTSPAPRPAAERLSPPAPSRQESPLTQSKPPRQTASSSPLPELSVTGIAWQKDSAARLAVVNGVSVAEGATIEGARVREILPDRVLFSFDTREFQVYLGKEAP